MFVFPNTISKFVGDSKTALEAGYISISDEEYADLTAGKLKWENGVIVTNPNYEAEKLEKDRIAKERFEKIETKKKIYELRYWFDSTYRICFEKFIRFQALEINETCDDPIRNKQYTCLMDLYLEAEIVRSEINELEEKLK